MRISSRYLPCIHSIFANNHSRRTPAQTPPLALLLATALCCIAPSLRGQQSPSTTIQGNTNQGIVLPQKTALLPRQDPGALIEIRGYQTAISLGSWIDMQGSGTLTSTAFNSSGGITPENATLWLRTQGYRLDVQIAKGTRSMRLDGAYGAVQHADGQVKAMDARDAVTGVLAFPMLMEVGFPAASVMLIDQGMVTVDGSTLHRISIESPWPGNLVDASGNPLTTVTDLYFDPQTHLLIKSAYATVGSKATSERYLCVITYGDYQAVNGMQIPFLYQESLNGQLLWTLQLNQVQLNQGLSQSEFQF